MFRSGQCHRKNIFGEQTRFDVSNSRPEALNRGRFCHAVYLFLVPKNLSEREYGARFFSDECLKILNEKKSTAYVFNFFFFGNRSSSTR